MTEGAEKALREELARSGQCDAMGGWNATHGWNTACDVALKALEGVRVLRYHRDKLEADYERLLARTKTAERKLEVFLAKNGEPRS